MFLKCDLYRVWCSIFYSKLVNCILLRSLFVFVKGRGTCGSGERNVKFWIDFRKSPRFSLTLPLSQEREKSSRPVFTMCGEPCNSRWRHGGNSGLRLHNIYDFTWFCYIDAWSVPSGVFAHEGCAVVTFQKLGYPFTERKNKQGNQWRFNVFLVILKFSDNFQSENVTIYGW
jgi:hypothetical protein